MIIYGSEQRGLYVPLQCMSETDSRYFSCEYDGDVFETKCTLIIGKSLHRRSLPSPRWPIMGPALES